MGNKDLYVYLLTNKNHTVIYCGVSSDLLNRVWKHKNKVYDGFTKKYNVDKLVYYEGPEDPIYAIEREKQIKAGSRQKKIDLIISMNPEWRDLYEDLIPEGFKEFDEENDNSDS
ncbi:GIY-YIG nuclease family protein [Gracilimonas mengyeensis]|uniref:Putative endonuclease n=1 Tax=Gracilimonas mengyeensis TaxID=1302730 RepID=A0A521CI89_9BACT|nr:GIY-YIG nuclease family protein [Gracilimonas mengyeensis]SMO59167.1 putative endonuclease [Gracilimonas mengyeensis]